MKEQLEIPIGRPGEGLGTLTIRGRSGAPMFLIDEAEATLNSEAVHQIVEGRSYEYKISGDLRFGNYPKVVQESSFSQQQGSIHPREYVGTFCLEVLNRETDEKVGEVRLEVRSSKTNYREDYRRMLGEIAEDCIDILFSSKTPIVQNLAPDPSQESQSMLQRFGFLRALLTGDEFRGAIARIMSYPVTRWAVTSEMQDTRRLRRVTGSHLRQIVSGGNRIPLGGNGMLAGILPTIPREISVDRKIETRDTPENRFVKHVLQVFLRFCDEVQERVEPDSRIAGEIRGCRNILEHYLKEGFFRSIPDLKGVHLNSPALQRKAGYREVLKSWLMFAQSAVLSWGGGDDVYEVNKRDVALLYEYWSFISLVKLFTLKFGLTEFGKLFEERDGGFEVSLKRGVMSGVRGSCFHNDIPLCFSLSFNRTFKKTDCPGPGTWSVEMRPDISLSFWPAGMDEREAEEREELIHLHFDSKYRIDRIGGLFEWKILGTDWDEDVFSDVAEPEENVALDELAELEYASLDQRQQEIAEVQQVGNMRTARANGSSSRGGGVKRDDLLKMHAYKDAIRRTSGAYVLYPGDMKEVRPAFHEVIPGLGAFPLNPATREENLRAIENFINDVLDNFVNRESFERGLAESRRHPQH